MEESLAMNSMNDHRTSTIVQNKPMTYLPGFDRNHTEVLTVEATPDENWMVLSAYEHQQKMGKLMVFRRRGDDLEYQSKISLMWDDAGNDKGK